MCVITSGNEYKSVIKCGYVSSVIKALTYRLRVQIAVLTNCHCWVLEQRPERLNRKLLWIKVSDQ